MRVLHVCSELYPLLKTGGLADVTGALPPALHALGCDARVLLPGFPAVMAGVTDARLVTELPARFGAPQVRLLKGSLGSVDGSSVYVIDAPALYARDGNPYADANNHAYADNHRRFALLGWVAAQLALGLDAQWQAQLLHCHDWHAGLAPAYLKAWELANGRRAAASVMTVHNLAYQGCFDASIFAELELPPEFFSMHGLEYYGQVSFLKAGLYYADRLTTVSPTYAREIQQPEQGCGLDGLLRERAADLVGILNGVDYRIWNPALDPLIDCQYSIDEFDGKRENRHRLQHELGLRVQDAQPLFGVVSRLTGQKGLQLLLAALPGIIDHGGQLVLLGSGDAPLQAAFQAAAAQHPQSVAVEIGYHEALSHRIIAAADVIVVPSLFEPCGLTQLYGLAYGTLPLVRRVGGLADSVTDVSDASLTDATATGFVFDQFSEAALEDALARVFALYVQTPIWQQVMRNAMRQHFGWDDAAGKLLHLYRQLLAA